MKDSGLFARISLTALSRTYFILKANELIYIIVQTIKPSITLHAFVHGKFIAWVGIIFYQITIKKGWVSDFTTDSNLTCKI